MNTMRVVREFGTVLRGVCRLPHFFKNQFSLKTNSVFLFYIIGKSLWLITG
jgi:hypothetical protein